MILTHNIGIQLLHPNARIPEKAHSSDAFYDVWAVDKEYLDDPSILGCRIKYRLGFALDVPLNFEVEVRARSSVNKHGLFLASGVGTGDEGHITEYSVVFYHLLKHLEPYEIGDRVAQIRCKPREDNYYHLVDTIKEKERGFTTGFGSSGLKDIGKYNVHIGDTYYK